VRRDLEKKTRENPVGIADPRNGTRDKDYLNVSHSYCHGVVSVWCFVVLFVLVITVPTEFFFP
jgi:hypothetical protein